MRKEVAPAGGLAVTIARLAGRQYGVVATGQLLELGLPHDAIKRRCDSGQLHRVHRGVYAVGHRALGREGQMLAAVLACGKDAVVSHRSAAELWELLVPIGRLVHLTIPGRNGRARRPGLRIHRPRSFDRDLWTTHRGIPVTTVPRTIHDLQGSVPAPLIRRALREAQLRGLPTDAPPDRTRSDLEREFLRICRRFGIAEPEINVRVGRHLVDFLWRDHGLVVEVDSFRYHRGRQAFRDDRDRDLELSAAGLRVARIADSRINDDPAGAASAVRRLLRRPRGD